LITPVTQPLQDKGGQVFNVKAYGATGDGVTDDTAAIQSAINAVPADGGIVFFPIGKYIVSSTLTIGDGTVSAYSTRHGLSLIGAGTNNLLSIRGARLFWNGAMGGQMINVNGPYVGFSIRELYLDCHNLANNALVLTHTNGGYFRNLYVAAMLDFGIVETARPNQFGVISASGNLWQNIFVSSTNPGSGGFIIGPTALSGGDVNQNLYQNLRIRFDSTTGKTTAIRLQACDFLHFDHPVVAARLPVDWAPPTGATGFPGAITWMAPALSPLQLTVTGATNASPIVLTTSVNHGLETGRTVTVASVGGNTAANGYWTVTNLSPTTLSLQGSTGNGAYTSGGTVTADCFTNAGNAWTGTTGGGNHVWSFALGDNEVIPKPSQTYVSGVANGGTTFGFFKNAPLYFAQVTDDTPIANTTTSTAFGIKATLMAGQANLAGTTVRIRCGGVYSTTGAPNITVKIRLGGTQVFGQILPASNNAANFAWHAECLFTVRTTGTSATIQNAGGALGFSGQPMFEAGAGSFTMDLTRNQLIDVQVTWGAASPSNTIKKQTMEVEVMYPSTTQ
jgi:hypothetical protein